MRALLLGLTVMLLAPACGNGDDPTLSPGASDSPRGASQSPAPEESSSAAPAESMTFEVWFTHGDKLFASARTQTATPRVGSEAVTAMLAGPSDLEADSEVGTAVPSGVRLNDLQIEDGIATADLSSNFESGGGSLSMSMRLAQLTYTLTQFPTVDGVLLELDGRPVDTFSNEGIVIDDPLRRKDFHDLLPLIVVTAPSIGDTVTSPMTVTGIANVFEATVSYRLLDANGHQLVDGFTTATCGTGCWGDYTVDVKFSVSSEQDGTLEVFESSAENGQPVNVVSIPVTLSP